MNLFRRVKSILWESSVKSDDILSMGKAMEKAAIDNEELSELKGRFEKIIRSSGHGESLRRINIIGFAKLIAYYEDAREARRFAEWSEKNFKNTKLSVTYKDLHVGASKAGVIFDFTRM